MMHAAERDRVILDLLEAHGFISFHELSGRLSTSPATLRRDMHRLQQEGKLVRVRGGAHAVSDAASDGINMHPGSMFARALNRQHAAEKQAIGKAAAALCHASDAVIIEGGSTTLQMCPHLEKMNLHVLTNSLQIFSVLLEQPFTRISISGGVVFRKQNIVLNPFEDAPAGFHAVRMFVGCAAISRFGLMQSDILLIQAQSKLLSLADDVVVLADSSKFTASAPHSLCPLSRIHTLITDAKAPAEKLAELREAGVQVIVADSADGDIRAS